MANILQTITNAIKHWYVPMIIGTLFILIGVYVFFIPLETYATLSFIFSLSFLTVGGLDIYFAIENRKSISGWGWHLSIGIITLLIGIYLIMNPEASLTTLPLYVGFALMFHSIRGLGFAFELREMKVFSWGDLAITSMLALLFSFFLIAHPVFTGFSLVALTSFSFIFLGVSAVVLSLKAKKLKNFPKKIENEIRDKLNKLKQEAEQKLSGA